MKATILALLAVLPVAAAAQSSGPGFPAAVCSVNLAGQTYQDIQNNLTYKCVNSAAVGGYTWQLGQSPVIPATADPTGRSCAGALPIAIYSGKQYTCQSGVLALAGGGSGSPGGSNQQIQYNNNSAFGGAAGGLTDGAHWAFGAGSTVDGGPTMAGPHAIPGVEVLNLSEASTDPGLLNGIDNVVTLDPSAPPTVSALAAYNLLLMNGSQDWSGSAASFGAIDAAEFEGTATGAQAPQLIAGTEGIALNGNSGEAQTLQGISSFTVNLASGTVDQAIGSEVVVANTGSGSIESSIGVDVNFQSLGGATTKNIGVYVEQPTLSGSATIGTAVGLEIDDQSGGGGATQGIDQEGTGDENDFHGPTIVENTLQVTAVAFASLPTCNSGAEGTQRPVNDSTTNTWGATITGGGSDHVLAYCDGTNWTVAAK